MGILSDTYDEIKTLPPAGKVIAVGAIAGVGLIALHAFRSGQSSSSGGSGPATGAQLTTSQGTDPWGDKWYIPSTGPGQPTTPTPPGGGLGIEPYNPGNWGGGGGALGPGGGGHTPIIPPPGPGTPPPAPVRDLSALFNLAPTDPAKMAAYTTNGRQAPGWYTVPFGGQSSASIASQGGSPFGWTDVAYNPLNKQFLPDAFASNGQALIPAGSRVWIP